MEGYQSGQMGRAVNPLTSVFEGSNPSPSTIQESLIQQVSVIRLECCGCSSMVEHQPSKLVVRVRFPSPAPSYYL